MESLPKTPPRNPHPQRDAVLFLAYPLWGFHEYFFIEQIFLGTPFQYVLDPALF